ncbi:MAG: hypothetical protein ACI857_003227 [Arenicella sp.]|jgi:uncharacterized protein (DUF983 family)
MKKGTKLYSIVKGTCPKCQETDLFKSKNPYNLSKVMEMNDECPNCGQSFRPEPGFYFGAMFVSYGLGVALFIATIVAILILAPETGPGWMFAWVLGVILISAPLSYRMSRKIWINFFVKYEGNPQHELKGKKLNNGIIQ